MSRYSLELLEILRKNLYKNSADGKLVDVEVEDFGDYQGCIQKMTCEL